MKSHSYKIGELILLFFIIPVSLAFPYPTWIKIALSLLTFLYAGVIYGLMIKSQSRSPLRESPKGFFKRVIILFSLLATGTFLFVWFRMPESLFCVPRTDLRLYLMILGIYTVGSVLPQEFLYRQFFFKRYEELFPKEAGLIIVNAALFMIAHLFFHNGLVLLLTFIGGGLFALTYARIRSFSLVSLEHALYGNWLFTVGMGKMLAFPGGDAC